MTWAFDVVLGDDDEWPEPRAHDESKCDALKVAKRLAWFEAILRVSFAARREKERDIGHMLPKPAEPERKRRRVNPSYETQKWRYIDIHDIISIK